MCYNLKDLRVGQRKKTLYWLIQENSIGFQVQTSLSYIPQTMICAYTTLSYPKVHVFCHKVNILLPCCMISFILDPFISFFMSHDPVTITVTGDVILNPNPKFQNKNKRKRKIEMRKELKIIRVYCFQL